MTTKFVRPELPSQIQSPCVRNCCLDDNDVCLGCGRSLTEIIAWGSADDEARLATLALANQRKHQQR